MTDGMDLPGTAAPTRGQDPPGGPPSGGDARAPSLWRRLNDLNGRVLLGGLLLVLILLLAAFAPLIANHDPLNINMGIRLTGPTSDNFFGTDNNGRDVFSRVVYGTRVSVFVGGGVVLFSTVIGTLIGLVAGYYRKLDGPFMRLMDGFMAFPGILLAIAIMAALGASARNVIIALTITYTPRTARVVRGKVLSVREETYVESARAIGLKDGRIIFRYILPNTFAPLMVQATFILALAIISEAGLSFIGAGTPPPTPSWGNILADGRGFMLNAPWMTLFPGLFIMISVLGLNIMGDGLRDVLDPRMKDEQ
ncbi:MAG: ABC transporter permease [Nitriliruptoraceae bacterium]